jgi:hypothetical protein
MKPAPTDGLQALSCWANRGELRPRREAAGKLFGQGKPFGQGGHDRNRRPESEAARRYPAPGVIVTALVSLAFIPDRRAARAIAAA